MDNEKQSGLRKRPLPTPSGSPSSADTTSSKVVEVVAPNTFYGDPPPTLPKKNGLGSSHTSYRYIPSFQPAEKTNKGSPPYEPTGEDWRSPELVQETEVRDDDMPALVSDWTRGRSPNANPISNWENGWVVNDTNIPIDGCSRSEEANWWDPDRRFLEKRPGPGVLPTSLLEELHDTTHSLYDVSLKYPDTIPPQSGTPQSSSSRIASPQGSSSRIISPQSSSSTSPSQVSVTSPRGSLSSSSWQPPTREELHEAIPNAHALYCRRENGWILLAVNHNSKLPPLAEGFLSKHPDILFPDPLRREKTRDCLTQDEFAYRPNFTHHFHHYPQAVSSTLLNYRRPPWERASSHEDETDDRMEGIEQTFPDGVIPLDLFVCCQCNVYVLVSDLIPGIISASDLDEFTRNRSAQPLPGQTGADAALIGLETIIKVLENLLFKNETRSLPVVPGRSFHNKIGVSTAALNIFKSLGFTHVPASDSNPETLAPKSSIIRPQKQCLLRAWAELNAWTLDYSRRHPPSVLPIKSFATIDNAVERVQRWIGAHVDQIPRTPLPGLMSGEHVYPLEYVERLGFTPTGYSAELLEFAYRAQCRCDPERTPQYYQALRTLASILSESTIPVPESLDILITSEMDRGRWEPREVEDAAKRLGFGLHNDIKVNLEEFEDGFVYNAYEHAMTRSWKEDASIATRKDLTRALHIIAEHRGSKDLKAKAEEGDGSAEMIPEKAYLTLEVPENVDEEMLITVYKMRVEDSPSGAKRMKDALGVIAKSRDSTRLKAFWESGEDPGKAIQVFHPEWPRGLNQLGNTCYLNSLLQYFYTIKDLRRALIPLEVVNDAKLSDDDLKKHRVGGRLVTRKEIIRSRKFVSGLANLFWELEHSDAVAITPELELAKLALVTSKDEEEDEHGRTEVATDSSADTDATLVDEQVLAGPSPTSVPPTSPTPSSGSVLGKRPRRTQSAPSMDVDKDGVESDGFIVVPSPGSPSNSDARKKVGTSEPILNQIEDVEMCDVSEEGKEEKENKPPPLPPRRKTEVNSDSVMMFGKQHDVAECMDNCMFQIETALLRFDDIASTDKDKTSIVKRLFYGTIRQRITPLQADLVDGRGSSVHEKEDVFSHLPVNVSEESFDIYDGLSGYFDDTVDFEGRKMRMEVSLVDIPPILQIQLQRVQFNRNTLQPYKSHAYVRFSETLYIDRFLDSADPAKRVQSKQVQAELHACRERIDALTREKGGAFAETLPQAHDFLANQNIMALSKVDDDLISHLGSESKAVQNELTELRAKASKLKEELEAIWKHENKVEYELTSVFVHRGSSPSWGHYFFYSRCLPDQPDVWFKYNDSEVTQVKKEEVLADTTGSTANPYLLVYARKGSDVVQTINRTDLTAAL